MWGKYIEGEVAKVKQKNHKKKNVNIDNLIQNRLRAILHPLDQEKAKADASAPKPAPKGRFADPAAGMIKKRSEL